MLSNPRSERVRSVTRLAGRSSRQKLGRFAAEGPQAVREAVARHGELLDAGLPGLVLDLYLTPDAAARHHEIASEAAARGIACHGVTDEVLAAMTDTVTPQGLLAVCRLVDVDLAEVLAGRPRLVAVLAHIRDPGNAGTVIRAADASGAGAVLLTDASVDVHNPKCVRASAGSIFHLPIVTGVPLAEAITALREAGCLVLAADGAGEHDLDDLSDSAQRRALPARPGETAGVVTSEIPPRHEPRLEQPVAWVFGNEAWGLPEIDRALADAVVRVPVYGRAESLNLATAATVCLYATARAQRLTRGGGATA